jgi:uncharacterized membrane protein YtjA (UPF0391 family)
MLRWGFLFLLVGLLVGLFGFTGIEGASFGIAKFLFVQFLAVFLVMAAIALTVFLAGPRVGDEWHQLNPLRVIQVVAAKAKAVRPVPAVIIAMNK